MMRFAKIRIRQIINTRHIFEICQEWFLPRISLMFTECFLCNHKETKELRGPIGDILSIRNSGPNTSPVKYIIHI